MTALAPDHITMPVFHRLRHAHRDEQIANIAEAAQQIRIQDLKLVHYAGAGHIGGDLSAIDILATLYGAVVDITPETADDPERDRFILSPPQPRSFRDVQEMVRPAVGSLRVARALW